MSRHQEGVVGRLVDPALIAISRGLPRKPASVVLVGERVTLRPVDIVVDCGPLFAASDGRAITLGDRSVPAYDADLEVWRYMPSGPFTDEAAMTTSLASQLDAPDGTPLTVVDRASGTPSRHRQPHEQRSGEPQDRAGWHLVRPHRTANRRQHGGDLAAAPALPSAWATGAWSGSATRSTNALAARRLRMGFRFEGIQEQHRITKGRNRDTAWFRIVAEEWPAVDALAWSPRSVEPSTAVYRLRRHDADLDSGP